MPKGSKDLEEAPEEEDEAEEAEEVDEEEEDGAEEDDEDEDPEEDDDEDPDEDEEEPEEDEEPEDEEEPEEAEEEASSKPSAKARVRQRKREDRAKRLRNRVIGATIALILIGAIAGAYFYTPAPSSVTIGALNDNTNEGVELLISATGGGVRGYSGQVSVTSTVNGSVTFNKKVTMKENVAHLTLSYADFVTENGNYLFEVKVGGKKGTTTVTVDNVVEDIAFQFGFRDSDDKAPFKALGKTVVTIYMTFIRWTSPTINQSVEAKPGQTMSLEIEDPAGHVSTKPDLNVSNKALADYKFDATLRGSYNFKATFVNNHIKTDSKHWSIVRAKDVLINAKPKSEAGPDISKTFVPGVGTKISVDGSNSLDDGAIVSYEWNFGVYTDPDDPNFGKDTITSDKPTAEWTYYTAGEYTVTLTVKDNGLSGVPDSAKFGSDWLIATILV